MNLIGPRAPQVFGIDGVQSLDKVREKLAYCPQHNILHDTLSVWEHMQLYGALRKLSTAQIEAEATELLTALQMLPKKHAEVRRLRLHGRTLGSCLGESRSVSRMDNCRLSQPKSSHLIL